MPTRSQARQLCQAVEAATAHRRSNGVQWVMLHTATQRLGWEEGETQNVATFAAANDWLLTEGTPPHSLALGQKASEILRGDSRRRVSRETK
jgi:hypothetical protein